MHSSELEGRYSIEGVGRIYTDHDDIWLPSVSTVINVRGKPDAVIKWEQRTDNHEQIKEYKQNRGTIAHAKCLQDLVPVDDSTGSQIKELWGKDERQSVQALQRSNEWERCQADIDTTLDMWNNRIMQYAHFDYVHDVETLVCNTDIGYAGQFDLCYEDHETGETVLADLKTSKAVYDKHLLQLAAYSAAVPMSIDRMEVIRVSPDFEDWRVLPHTQWDEDPEDLLSHFIKLRGELEKQQLETIIQQAKGSGDEEEGVMYEPMAYE